MLAPYPRPEHRAEYKANGLYTEALGLIDGLKLTLGLVLGLTDGLKDTDGLVLTLGLVLGLIDGLKDTEGLVLTLGL